jgi:hypothetical protein
VTKIRLPTTSEAEFNEDQPHDWDIVRFCHQQHDSVKRSCGYANPRYEMVHKTNDDVINYLTPEHEFGVRRWLRLGGAKARTC